MAFTNEVMHHGFETGSLPPWAGFNASVTAAYSHSGFYSALLAGGTSNSYVYQFVEREA